MTEKNYSRICFTFLFFTILYLSWLIPFSRHYWDIIDTASYLFFNSWIASSLLSQTFWAIMNHSLNDWVFDVIMLFFVIAYIFSKKSEKSYRSVQIFLLILFCALVTIFINRYLLPDIFNIRRLSPSLVIEKSVRLSHHIPWLKIKETHKACFPSDHGTTTIFFTLIIFYLMGKKYGLLSLFFSLLYSLPRMVVGAHWLTDALIGSFSISALSLTLFLDLGILHQLTTYIVSPLSKRKDKQHAPSISTTDGNL
ncbi:MAG: phosphatase PAP2 family protein [Chlamydiales bacterium]|nr:phosphatase PAP2 family protein [Chlamydiales bacterium]